jgi:hypothetical protein
MTSRISKGSITGRAAFSNGGLGLSIGSRVGGARRMISTRAPDASKISGGAPAATIYKISGYITTFTPSATARPYISSIISSQAIGGPSSSQMFEKQLDAIVFEFKPTDASNSDAVITMTVSPVSGENPIDILFSYVSNNVYSFVIPPLSDAISSSSTSPATRYTNGNTDVLVSAAGAKLFTFQFAWSGVTLSDGPDFTRFTTMINDIVSKTYTFTLSANNKFALSSSGSNIYSGVFNGVVGNIGG